MPVPTAYTEADLAVHAARALGVLGQSLNWATADGVPVAGALDGVVNDALLDYGVMRVDEITWTPASLVAMRFLVVRAAWRLACRHLAGRYDVVLDGTTFSRSQLQRQALAALQLATADAAPYDRGRAVTIHSTARRGDPYAVPADGLEAAGVAVEALP